MIFIFFKNISKKLIVVLFLICSCFLASCSQADKANDDASSIDSSVNPVTTPVQYATILGKSIPITEINDGYTFDLFGQTLNTKTTTELYYEKVDIGDDGLDMFREVIPYMQNLNYISFDRCETTDEAMASLREEFRDNVKIAWRVFFGANFTNMSDAETIWASCDIYTDEQAENLKYFEDLINLDVGHCYFSDLSFLYSMPKLEVLIVACNTNIEDITPIGSLKNLKYLEICETGVSDLSPLSDCESLEDINFGCNQLITDLSPLKKLKNLKRICAYSMYNSALNMEKEAEEFEELFPEAYVDFEWYGSNNGALNPGKWKWTKGLSGGDKVPRYAEIFDIFGYDNDYDNPNRQLDYLLE